MPPTVATSTRADAPAARKEDAPKRKRELNARVVRPPRRPGATRDRAREPPAGPRVIRPRRPLVIPPTRPFEPQSARFSRSLFLPVSARALVSTLLTGNASFFFLPKSRAISRARRVPQCQVVGCEETYSSVHECRARACTAHCSAEAVELEGREPGTRWRYCYQCHKFHELEAFSSPDGSALALHNCYGSQQRRLKRRKLKEQEKQQDVAAKKLTEELERRTGGAHAGPLFATLHQPAVAAFSDAVSAAAAVDAAGPWAVSGATIAARRLGAKAAMSAGTWAVTPLATPPSSGEVSPKGAYLHLGASPTLLPPMEDKLMHALDDLLAHSPSPEL